MKKIIVIILVSLLLIYSCGSDEQKINKQDNVLLAKEVTVTSLVSIDNYENSEWTANLKREELFKKTFEKAITKKITVYGGSSVDFGDMENKKPYPLEDLNEKMNWNKDNQNYAELKEILFYERWYFDKEHLKFTKEILGWSPIRIWKKDGEDDSQLRRTKMFYIYPLKNKEVKQIGENIKYEIQLQSEYPAIFAGFDQRGFLKFIFEGIKSGQITAYDPIYIVDKSKRKFTSSELAEYIGQELDAGLINVNMSSILFEEDWYFDENTLAIQKDVKSFAFVQYTSGWETSIQKKFMFFIFPKE